MRRRLLIASGAGAVIAALALLVFVWAPKKPVLPKPAQLPPPVVQPAKAVPAPCADQNYAVSKNDGKEGLWGISKRVYSGNPFYNYRIAQANLSRYPSLGKNPHLIKAGWVLTVPCLANLPALDKRLVAVRPLSKALRTARAPKSKGKAMAIVCPPCPCSPAASKTGTSATELGQRKAAIGLTQMVAYVPVQNLLPFKE